MAVEQDIGSSPIFPDDAEIPGFLQLSQELVDHICLARDSRNVYVVRKEIAILVAQGQDATRFGADDRDPLMCVRRQDFHVAPRELACFLDESL